MKSKERLRLVRAYGNRYSRHYHDSVKPWQCFYCGDDAQTLDHVPPLSWVETYSPETWRSHGVPFVLLHVCHDCNSRLSNKPLFTAYERTQALEAKLSALYDRKASLWSDYEIAEMGPSFRASLIEHKAAVRRLADRIRHLQWRLLQHESFPVLLASDD